jgi:high affinity Mn2+ porin
VLCRAACCLGIVFALPSLAQDQNWNIHFQATSIGDVHGGFPSPYEGLNSLPPYIEKRVSITATVFFALRLGDHTVLVLDPELAGGKGFGMVTGLAGFPNGEIPRVASATPTPYLARGFIQNTWAIGDDVEMVEEDANQLGGRRPVKRFTLIAGKFALTDYFGVTTYSNDPREQFMNWSLMYNGAWDYPADSRGYTVGTMQELTMRAWSVRAAVTLEPTVANGPDLDTRALKNRGLAAEGERRYSPFGRAGAIKILGFINREHAGVFREALQLAHGGVPDLGPTRRNGNKKYGFALTLEQALTPDIGVFSRYGWSDGKTESWAFTQIDRSVSGGISIGGRSWKRPLDRAGIGAVRNYLSGDQRTFLAAGGVGFIIGDGRLNYRPESIIEAYYAWKAAKDFTVSLDYQRVANPAYNRDRGPVNVESLRLHWER